MTRRMRFFGAMLLGLGALGASAWLILNGPTARGPGPGYAVLPAPQSAPGPSLQEVPNAPRSDASLVAASEIPIAGRRQEDPPGRAAPYLTIELRGPGGAPVAGKQISVEYRLRRGSQGTDQGKTNHEGHFATSTHAVLEIEAIEVQGGSGVPYQLRGGSLAVSPERPGILVVQLTQMRSVQVKVTPPSQPNGEPWAVWVEPAYHVSANPFVSLLGCAEYGGFYASNGVLNSDVSEGLYSVYLSESDTPAVEVFVGQDPTVVHFLVEEPEPAPKLLPEVPGLIRGRVCDAASRAGVRAVVRAMGVAQPPKRFGNWSDDQGRFEARASDKVRYVGAEADGYAFGITGPLDPADNAEIEIRLERPTSVSGRVIDPSGEAVTSGRVRLFRSNAQLRAPGTAPADPAPLPVSFEWSKLSPKNGGRFAFEAVTAGPLRLIYEPYEPSMESANAVVFGGDTNVTLVPGIGDAHGTRLDVMATDAQSGAPLEGVCLSFSEEPLPLYLTRRPGASFTNKNGQAVMFCEPQESGWVCAWMTPRSEIQYVARRIQSQDLRAGTQGLSIELERAATVFLCVCNKGGAPIVGARVSAETSSGEAIRFQSMIGEAEWTTMGTDHNGRVDLRGVPEGGFSLVVHGPSDPGNGTLVPLTHRLAVEPLKSAGSVLTVTLDRP